MDSTQLIASVRERVHFFLSV